MPQFLCILPLLSHALTLKALDSRAHEFPPELFNSNLLCERWTNPGSAGSGEQCKGKDSGCDNIARIAKGLRVAPSKLLDDNQRGSGRG